MSEDEGQVDVIGLRAAEWVARLDGSPLTEAETGALRDWLAQDPDHRAAFEEASATWRDLALLRRDPGPLRDLVPARRRPVPARRAAVIGALVGLMVLVAVGARYQFGDPWLLATADYRTAPGEVRAVSLPDGSTAELGPASAIAVDYDNGERRVRLLAGEVFFAALPRDGRETRPFLVEAAGGTTTALGTQFVVEKDDEGADVLAIEHQIEVTMQQDGERQGVVLSPGQEVRYRRGAGLGHVHARDVAIATAWRRGMLVFNGARLGQVVETLNRYRRGRIVILDEALAERRVSGVFATSDLGDAIETITSELGIGQRSLYPFITVLY
ncbi:FecR family protein [Ancylobacter radicis]|uniref:FecR family protein n=1 Tax=Ancylobacter radicis TaxID=2836179 RepID=A0ABS5RBD1_9HYPH|nr:FecR family protein [Ancylobacter radicis]